MPNPLALTLQATGAQTSNGTSTAFDLNDSAWNTDGLTRRAARLLLEVTAASGTEPVLKITIQTSPNQLSWRDVLEYSEVGGPSYQRLALANLERYVRVKWEVSGSTPSFTFQVTGDAEVIYANEDDFFAFGLPARAVGDTEPVDLLARSLIAASSVANAQIPRAYVLPLVYPYPESLRINVARIAGYSFLSQRGFDPDDAADKEVKSNHDDAMKWLDMLGGGTLPDWIDATPDTFEGGAAIASAPRRGF